MRGASASAFAWRVTKSDARKWRMHMLDMRQPFKPDDTSAELELRQIHALNYIAARMGEIEWHLGKIAA